MNPRLMSFFLFLVGLLAHLRVRLIGMIGISEILICLVAPVLFVKNIWYLKRDGFMPMVGIMFLFFIFGMLVLKPHLNTILSWRVGFFCLFIFATVIFLEGDIKTNQLGFYWCSRSIASLKPFAFFLVRLALGIVGSLAVLFSIKYLPVRAMRFLATFGATSFGVYLLHQWILDRVADLNIFPLSFLSCLFLSAAIFLFCHLVVLLLRIGWFRAAIWGEEILISKFCAR